jgi:MraZ protein
MDEKGRVSLPSAFRRGADGERFVLLQQPPAPSLTLFPRSTWQEVQQRLLEYRTTSDEARIQVMGIVSQAVEVKPDKQGRILIPSWLQKSASLEHTVRLVGNIDRIELWNPATFDVVMNQRTDSFRQFATKIFG